MLAVVGTITTRTSGNGSLAVLLTVKSSRTQEAVTRLAGILGCNVNHSFVNGKPALMFTLAGKKLHEVMIQLWPELPDERRQEYRAAKKRTQA